MRGMILLVAALFCVGCGGAAIVPVSGTVKLNGSPLPHATVIFMPESTEKEPGPGSAGVTDANGRYELRLTTSNAAGAVIGKHKVSITAYSGDGDPDSSAPTTGDKVFRKALLPGEYNAQSKLTFEVPAGGTSSADFPLTTK